MTYLMLARWRSRFWFFVTNRPVKWDGDSFPVGMVLWSVLLPSRYGWRPSIARTEKLSETCAKWRGTLIDTETGKREKRNLVFHRVINR